MSKKRTKSSLKGKKPTKAGRLVTLRRQHAEITRRGEWAFPVGSPAGRVDHNEGTLEAICDDCGNHVVMQGFNVHGPCPVCGCETGTYTGRFLGDMLGVKFAEQE